MDGLDLVSWLQQKDTTDLQDSAAFLEGAATQVIVACFAAAEGQQ